MPKNGKEVKDEKKVEEVAPKSEKERKARWDAFLTKAKEDNPVKFEAREKAGKFKKIPASFV